MSKKFLIPVGAAVAALSPTSTNASIDTQSHVVVDIVPEEKLGANNTTLHVMQYVKGNEKHELLMKKTDDGLLFAQHRSHYSHSSHGSHRSSR